MALQSVQGFRRDVEAAPSKWRRLAPYDEAAPTGSGLGIAGSIVSYGDYLAKRGSRIDQRFAPPSASGLEEFVSKLASFWQLSIDQGAVLAGYGAQGTAEYSRVIAGLAKFTTVDQRDRALELFAIRKLLAGLYRNRDVENRWLRSPNAGLEGQSPLQVLLQGSLSNILRLRQFLESLAGV